MADWEIVAGLRGHLNEVCRDPDVTSESVDAAAAVLADMENPPEPDLRLMLEQLLSRVAKVRADALARITEFEAIAARADRASRRRWKAFRRCDPRDLRDGEPSRRARGTDQHALRRAARLQPVALESADP